MAHARTASIVIGGAVRLPVRSYGLAGSEAIVELDASAPGMVGSAFELIDGDDSFAGTVLEQHDAEGRTTFVCTVEAADRPIGATGS